MQLLYDCVATIDINAFCLSECKQTLVSLHQVIERRTTVLLTLDGALLVPASIDTLLARRT